MQKEEARETGQSCIPSPLISDMIDQRYIALVSIVSLTGAAAVFALHRRPGSLRKSRVHRIAAATRLGAPQGQLQVQPSEYPKASLD